MTIHHHNQLTIHHPIAWSTCLERVCKIFLTWSRQFVSKDRSENLVDWSDIWSSRNWLGESDVWNSNAFMFRNLWGLMICTVLLLDVFEKKSFTRGCWENERKTSRNARSLQNTNQKWKPNADRCVWQYPCENTRWWGFDIARLRVIYIELSFTLWGSLNA